MTTRVVRELIVIDDAIVSRFMAKTVRADNGCLIWTGAVSRNGYGKFYLSDGSQESHVVAWRMSNGGVNVPEGMLVMHSCECRLCVAPGHLVVGTQSQNTTHANRNRRLANFRRHGSDVVSSVLTEDQVIQIRSKFVPGKYSYTRIAAEMNLNRHTVRSVCIGKTWKHIR